MVWWRENPEEFDRFKKELAKFPFLSFRMVGDKVNIEGRWPVYGKSKLVTEYEIKIEVPDDYPVELPVVFEVGGRIPKEPDFHINPSDSSACLLARPERWEKWPPGAGIREFLNGPVREFFFSQAYRELNGDWPFGEWSHGEKGIIEYFADRLGATDLLSLYGLLKLAGEPKLYRQWRCPCESGRRVTACHADAVTMTRQNIPAPEIDKALTLVDAELKKGRRRLSEIE